MAGDQWVRVDVDYLSNPKVRRAGRDGALLHLAAIGYLARHEQGDGLLPPEALEVIGPLAWVRRPESLVARMAKAGLWHPSLDGTMLVHDFSVMNGDESPSALSRERQRRKRTRDRSRRDEWLDERDTSVT